MKKYITAALLFCAALTAACSKETAGSADTGDTGALEMRVSATRAEADGEYDPLQRLAVRIYRASGELLRQYTAETLPSRLELLAGEYRVEVDAGEAVPASFTKRFYKGEKTFTVAAGQTTVAEVECKRQNVVAEVKFDATVSAAFGENFHAWVVAADAFDEGQVQQGGVPALNYTADGTGYFTMPEGATTLTTRFEGTHPDRGVIVTNPPYGERLGDASEAAGLAKTLGQVWQAHPAQGLYAITADADFEQHFGKKAARRRKIYNGMIPCQLYMYFEQPKRERK